jgi:hypothetical protein
MAGKPWEIPGHGRLHGWTQLSGVSLMALLGDDAGLASSSVEGLGGMTLVQPAALSGLAS